MDEGSAAIGLAICLAWLAYTYVGYAALVSGLAGISGKKQAAARLPKPTEFPSVTVVISAYNEEDRMHDRIRNLLACRYPRDKLQILIVSDGSVDRTAEVARRFPAECVRVVVSGQHRGKACALNLGLTEAAGEIVVFADMRQEFEPTVLERFGIAFADPSVGAVSGNLVIGSGEGSRSGFDLYWSLEKRIRRAEAVVDSCIGCTGAIYAIRRKLYEPLPEDTILDDVVIPMTIARKGYRVLYDWEARAHDPQPLEYSREKSRKRRTMAGNFQMFFRYPSWLLPWKNRLWWQLLSHKYMRLGAPLALAGAFGLNALCLSTRGLALVFVLQCLCYAGAALGALIPPLRRGPVSLCTAFLFLNLQVVSGFAAYLRRAYTAGWRG